MRINIVTTTVIISAFVSACSRNNSCFINPAKVIQGYHGTTAQHDLFQVKTQEYQQRLDSLSAEVQSLSKTSATRAAKEQQLQRYREAVQQQAQQENQRMTKAVLDEINTYLKQYGKEKGYAFILGATESGNIVYAAEDADITEEVLKGLNEQYDRQHPRAIP